MLADRIVVRASVGNPFGSRFANGEFAHAKRLATGALMWSPRPIADLGRQKPNKRRRRKRYAQAVRD